MRHLIFTWRGVCRLLALLGGLILLCLAPAATAPADTPVRAPVIVLTLDGAVGPASADYVTKGLNTAAARKAPIVILRMDTPGGLDTSMRAIIRAILASPVPVASYVAPSGARAASAGTFILYASHVAAMAPGTNTGAATPVQIGGITPTPDKDQAKKTANPMEAKAVNDAVGFIRSLAELRGRNAGWAEKAVREAASLSASAALRARVIDMEARDITDLLRQLHGRTVKIGAASVKLDVAHRAIEEIPPDWRTRLLATITDPNVALILMMIGVYGMVFEFMNPGSFLPGTLGAICLLTGLYAFAALPVNFAGFALILLGVGLLIAEGFLFSHGVLGVGGVVAFALGAAMLIDADTPAFRISWSLIAGLSLATAAVMLLVVRTGMAARKRRIVSGVEEMTGAPGVVQDWGGGKGHVFVHGERWSATGHGDFAHGQPVRIVRLKGLTVEVEGDAAKEV
ncbi:MAG TPA: nodulation protein NfeD [Sphingobium sp.]